MTCPFNRTAGSAGGNCRPSCALYRAIVPNPLDPERRDGECAFQTIRVLISAATSLTQLVDLFQKLTTSEEDKDET